jgi:hypothetical protein
VTEAVTKADVLWALGWLVFIIGALAALEWVQRNSRP